MRALIQLEKAVMIAIWKLKGDALGVEIKKQAQRLFGQASLANTPDTSLDSIVMRFGKPALAPRGRT